MDKIYYSVTLGNININSKNTGSLISLMTHASLNVPVNSCSIVLAFSKDMKFNRGDDFKVELGYEEDKKLVFTGKVYTTDISLETQRVMALGSFTNLTTRFCNLMYLQSPLGSIIEDLLQQGGVEKGQLKPGMTLAVYGVSDHFSLYDEIKRLAMCNGFDFYADKEDKAQCKSFLPGNPVMCSYASNILRFNRISGTPVYSGVEVYGESPAGQGQGDEAVSWLTKKDVKGEAGDASMSIMRRFKPGARNTDNAGTMAMKLMDEEKKTEYAEVLVLGNADLELAGSISVSQMPYENSNASYKIIGVSHRLCAEKGFTTLLELEKQE